MATFREAAMTNSIPQQRASKAPPPAINLLMAAALEAWCHNLLYVRRVYPSSTFCDSYFLSARYKANRHPGVVEYISKAIQVAVPALINRAADEFSLEVIMEEEQQSEDENYVDGEEEEEPSKLNNPLLLSSESSLSKSQEEGEALAQRPRGGGATRDIKPSALFPNEQSLSSNSSTRANNRNNYNADNSQDTKTSSNTAPLQLQQPKPSQDGTFLTNRYLHVLEKFTLSFSSPSPDDEEGEETKQNEALPIRNVEDLAPKKRQEAPLFSSAARPKRQRRSSKQQQPTPEELQEQAVLQELERGFRNLVLNTANLKRDRVVLPCDSLTFKLVLRVRQTDEMIDKALDTASWYPCSAETKVVEAQRRPHMPLYQVQVGDQWDIHFHMQRHQQISSSTTTRER